jgi:hypothetical protein
MHVRVGWLARNLQDLNPTVVAFSNELRAGGGGAHELVIPGAGGGSVGGQAPVEGRGGRGRATPAVSQAVQATRLKRYCGKTSMRGWRKC